MLKQYLTTSFISDVFNENPKAIVAKYETHIFSDLILGAKLSVSYRSETLNSDRKDAATKGVEFSVLGVFNLSSTNTVAAQGIQANFNQKIYFEAIGGEPSSSLFGTLPIGGLLFQSILKHGKTAQVC